VLTSELALEMTPYCELLMFCRHRIGEYRCKGAQKGWERHGEKVGGERGKKVWQRAAEEEREAATHQLALQRRFDWSEGGREPVHGAWSTQKMQEEDNEAVSAH
jgi:hypothetical protein